MTIYAIPDVHGHPGKLAAAHDLVAADRAREGAAGAPVIHLGDLCDRGPDTRGVIDALLAGLAAGENWTILRGNHDRMFAAFVERGETRDPGLRPALGWLDAPLGGAETLRAYGVAVEGRPLAEVWRDAQAAVPEAHRSFLAARPLWHEAGEVLFVHAGIRPGLPLAAQTEDDLVWIRAGFLDRSEPHPWLVVHGHTVVERPLHLGNRVALDAGAAFGGPLVAAVFEGREVFLLTPQGRVPLRPDA